MTGKKILVVDDIKDVNATIRGILEDAGYSTTAATSREEALHLLENEYFHVAVLDVRLDESDEDNQDGLKLMHDIADQYDATATIMLTGYADVNMVQEALQSTTQRPSPAFRFLVKSDMMKLPKYVEDAFTLRLNLNENLVILDPEDSIKNLAGRINARMANRHNQADLEDEIREVLQKMFHDCQKIQIFPMTQGFSGAAVFRVIPWYQNRGEGENLVVKIGEKTEIDTEQEKYNQIIKGTVGGHRIPQGLGQARAYRLAGILYTFVGMTAVVDFTEYYAKNSPEAVDAVLSNLYLQTCFPKRQQRGETKTNFDLKLFYCEHLHLTENKLQAAFERAVNPKHSIHKSEHGLVFGQHIVTDPIAFAKTTDFHSNVFTAIIHGDIYGSNIFVDVHDQTWLIDFATTLEHGHILQDYVSLENFIRTFGIATDDLDKLYEWDKSMMFTQALDQCELSPLLGADPAFEKAHRAIIKIRQFATATPRYSNRSYLIALFFNTLRTATIFNLPRPIRDHAFLAASLIAERLSKGVAHGQV